MLSEQHKISESGGDDFAKHERRRFALGSDDVDDCRDGSSVEMFGGISSVENGRFAMDARTLQWLLYKARLERRH